MFHVPPQSVQPLLFIGLVALLNFYHLLYLLAAVPIFHPCHRAATDRIVCTVTEEIAIGMTFQLFMATNIY